MILHDVVAFGAGFGCGVLWLGFAFTAGHRLRRCQPPEAFDIGLTGADTTMPELRRSGDRGAAPQVVHDWHEVVVLTRTRMEPEERRRVGRA